MSLLLHGPEESIRKLSSYVRFYSQLLENNGNLPNDLHHKAQLNEPIEFILENKYYSADLKMHLHPLTTSSELDMQQFEGMVLVPSVDKVHIMSSYPCV